MSTNITFMKDQVWNAITGCEKQSPGCKNCISHAAITRLQKKKNGRYCLGAKPTVHEDRFDEPLRTKVPRRIIVSTMGDFFADGIHDNYRHILMNTMVECSQHIFIISTKYGRNMQRFLLKHFYENPQYNDSIPQHIWFGVSASTQEYAIQRIEILRHIPAGVRFLSLEPLIQNIYLENLHQYLDWVTVSGEIGTNARYMNPDWADGIRLDCLNASIPFYFKSLGIKSGVVSRERHLLNGKVYHNYPQQQTQRTWEKPLWEN